jgi:hypothetical protein
MEWKDFVFFVVLSIISVSKYSLPGRFRQSRSDSPSSHCSMASAYAFIISTFILSACIQDRLPPVPHVYTLSTGI